MLNHLDRIKREATRRTTIYVHNVGGGTNFDRWYSYYFEQLLMSKPYKFSWEKALDLRYPLPIRLYWKVYNFFYQWIKYKRHNKVRR